MINKEEVKDAYGLIAQCREETAKRNLVHINNVPDKDILLHLAQKYVKLGLSDVSHRRKLYFDFMKEYNALQGEDEQEILPEEVEVLVAKYSD